LLGVKYGEWLLLAATVPLVWATWQLVKSVEKTAERQLRAYVVVTCKDLIFHAGKSETPDKLRRISYKYGQPRMLSPTCASQFRFSIRAIERGAQYFTLGAGLAIDHDSIATRVLDQNEIVKIKSTDSERSLYNYGIVK
jgi:hypothetical protein